MRITKQNKQFALIQCPMGAMWAVTPKDMAFAEFHRAMQPGRRNTELLLNTYAKAYYHGGGWWHIHGYHSDSSDLDKVLEVIYLWGTP